MDHLNALREFFFWRNNPKSHPLDRPPLTVNEKDGSILVWIPPGVFEMGDGQDSDCPKHQVVLDGYYLGVHCITNRQYQRFLEATGHWPPDKVSEGVWPTWRAQGYPDHPVVSVSWEDAQAYCIWAGLALPTEAQWERAARGQDNLLYPWGNDWDAGKYQKSRTQEGICETTCPAWAYPQGTSVFGTMNQIGNVFEWCKDRYDKDYYRNSQVRNPEGPSTGSNCVCRGYSHRYGRDGGFRAAERSCAAPANRRVSIGFRPCLSLGQSRRLG